VRAIARYAQRMARLPDALAILELHPEGLPLTTLSRELGESPEALREAFLAYYRADVVDLVNFRLPVIEFVGGPDADPRTAEVVRVVSSDPERELGVAHLSASQLGELYAAGTELLALEPGNQLLADAVAAFREGLWSAADDAVPPDAGDHVAARLNDAAHGRHRVRVSYARTWQPGSRERVIEPYRVVRTRRGWEADAGPVHADGTIRTYLVSGITDLAVLDETFVRPADVDALIAANRAPVEVELVVPQSGRWAVDRFAESATVLADDEESVKLRASFLPPVDQRVGLVLLCCGPDAFVMAPATLHAAGADLARRLLEHHRGA
jgi:predicted DNA-binding transcriptional regulator YafY